MPVFDLLLSNIVVAGGDGSSGGGCGGAGAGGGVCFAGDGGDKCGSHGNSGFVEVLYLLRRQEFSLFPVSHI